MRKKNSGCLYIYIYIYRERERERERERGTPVCIVSPFFRLHFTDVPSFILENLVKDWALFMLFFKK